MTAPNVDVTEALKPFGSSRMLPAEAYTSPEVFAWEQRELFAGTWACVGRVAELFDGTTSQRGVVVGGVPVLLTRADDGVLAFADTCRHRGHELLGAGGCSARR